MKLVANVKNMESKLFRWSTRDLNKPAYQLAEEMQIAISVTHVLHEIARSSNIAESSSFTPPNFIQNHPNQIQFIWGKATLEQR